eukprot:GDKI01035414.1.p1 GENE.GDKI01035414.1~~GDKI01035414.1.p1  ORF type:complete len:214 (+),score=31.73 GDKI01035414.1:42-683(+)
MCPNFQVSVNFHTHTHICQHNPPPSSQLLLTPRTHTHLPHPHVCGHSECARTPVSSHPHTPLSDVCVSASHNTHVLSPQAPCLPHTHSTPHPVRGMVRTALSQLTLRPLLLLLLLSSPPPPIKPTPAVLCSPYTHPSPPFSPCPDEGKAALRVEVRNGGSAAKVRSVPVSVLVHAERGGLVSAFLLPVGELLHETEIRRDDGTLGEHMEKRLL